MIDIEKYRNNNAYYNNGNPASNDERAKELERRRQESLYRRRLADSTSQEFISQASRQELVKTAERLIVEGVMNYDDAIKYMTDRGATEADARYAADAIMADINSEREQMVFSTTRWPWVAITIGAIIAYNSKGSYFGAVVTIAATLYLIYHIRAYAKTKKFAIHTAAATLLSAVALAFCIYHSTDNWQDNHAFKLAKEKNTYRKYIKLYPKGKHVDEAITHIVQDSKYNPDTLNLYLPKMLDDAHKEELTYDMAAHNKTASAYAFYLHNWPKGKHADEASNAYNTLWDKEIERYEARDKQGEDPKATAFVDEMLHYMKAHRVHDIHLAFIPDVDTRGINQYSKDVQRILKENRIIDFTDYYSEDKQQNYEQIITSGFKTAFETAFTPGFVNVTTETTQEAPKLNIKYTIRNENEYWQGKNIPVTWSSERMPLFDGIGLEVFVESNFTIPGSQTTYTYKSKGNTTATISATDWGQAYNIMISRCFEDFTSKLTRFMRIAEDH